jgi:hypothetical protein
MTLLNTPRSRRLILWATLVSLSLMGFLFVHYMAAVHAATQAVTNVDARVASDQAPPPNANPVLVELFTSEGCSSCPPADALLARLQQQQPVASANAIVLEEHVDYWESSGWHDRFSSRQFTDRQTTYAQHLRLDDNYTPQMIVDGTDQFVGNDTTHALRSITQAARTPKLSLTLSLPKLEGNNISATISIAPGTTVPTTGLYAALVEPTASTQVRGGENEGHTLHHVSVVRTLVRIGSLEALGHAPISFKLPIPKNPNAPLLRVVVFAQRDGPGAVLAAASSTTVQLTTPLPSQQISSR